MERFRKAEDLRPSKETLTIAECLERVHSNLAGRTQLLIGETAPKYFPDRPHTIVPLAISLAVITQSAEQTTLLAANIGGDSDSVASIGSAIAAALNPATVNEEWYQVVKSINKDNLVETAISLAGLRSNI
jgi:hypothetical protein